MDAPILFAQTIDSHSVGIGLFVLCLVGAALGTILVITRWGIQHSARARELEHKERLRALECGFTLPGDRSTWTPVRVALAIGVVVPLGAFLAAAVAAESGADAAVTFPTACGLAVPALICGTVLAYRLRGEDFNPRPAQSTAKPYLDEAEREMAEYAS